MDRRAFARDTTHDLEEDERSINILYTSSFMVSPTRGAFRVALFSSRRFRAAGNSGPSDTLEKPDPYGPVDFPRLRATGVVPKALKSSGREGWRPRRRSKLSVWVRVCPGLHGKKKLLEN